MPKAVLEIQCEHPSRSDEAGNPDHNGRCRTWSVCDDCGDARSTNEFTRVI